MCLANNFHDRFANAISDNEAGAAFYSITFMFNETVEFVAKFEFHGQTFMEISWEL